MDLSQLQNLSPAAIGSLSAIIVAVGGYFWNQYKQPPNVKQAKKALQTVGVYIGGNKASDPDWKAWEQLAHKMYLDEIQGMALQRPEKTENGS